MLPNQNAIPSFTSVRSCIEEDEKRACATRCRSLIRNVSANLISLGRELLRPFLFLNLNRNYKIPTSESIPLISNNSLLVVGTLTHLRSMVV